MSAYPQAFVETMRVLLGDEADAFFAALGEAPALALRANPLRPFAAGEFVDSPVPWADGGSYLKPGARPGASIAHAAGAFYVQEASAMMPAAVLAVKPGMRVLDLCAAPGGKSAQLAAALAGKGVLVANEPDKKRAWVLAGNIERMGVPNALVVCESPERLAARWPGFFGAVLVDAPCSGEGMFRRDPDARAQWRESAPAGCAKRQAAILDEAEKLLAPGGRLVYSTCTYNDVENEGVARAFLAAHPNLRPVDFALPGLGASTGGMLRAMPHRARADGQFAALFQKDGAPHHPNICRTPDKNSLSIASRFADQFAPLPKGAVPALLGDTLYAIPGQAPETDGLRIVTPGLALARVLPGRLEPMHACAMADYTLPRAALDEQAALAYLRGEPIPFDGAGWLVAAHAGLPLGWGKASGGFLKNHLPKGLRRT